MKKIIIQSVVRFVFGMFLVVIVWYRVDWSVGLFAFLVLLRAELVDLNDGLEKEAYDLRNKVKELISKGQHESTNR